MPGFKVTPIDGETKSDGNAENVEKYHKDNTQSPAVVIESSTEKDGDLGNKDGVSIDIGDVCDEKKQSPPPSYAESQEIVLDVEKDAKNVEEVGEEDPWDLVIQPSTDTPWSELSWSKRILRVTWIVFKVIVILLLLYLFICSLDLLGSAFQLVGGKTAGEAFSSDLMQNPMCGLIIGIWATVILQSSSTTTSITVTMVASNILTVEQAIYIIMGSNIGTSFTSSLVALGQVAERNHFRRAFAGSQVLYIFNLLTVSVLLPIEWAFGYIYYVTKAIVDSMDLLDASTEDDGPKFLSVITDPFISLIIQVDKDVLTAVAQGSFSQKRPMTKFICDKVPQTNYTYYPEGTNVEDQDYYKEVRDSLEHPLLWSYDEDIATVSVTNNSNLLPNESVVEQFSYKLPDFDNEGTLPCTHLFVGAGLPDVYEPAEGWPHINLSDAAVGVILLIVALVTLCSCLVGMVKVLNSLLKGSVLGAVRKLVNSNLPCGVVGKEITGYLIIVIGAILTILVQSSSVFTSALNPLIGMGIVTLERTYPLTLGANIGTTITALLAAFTADPDTIANSLQVAFAHLAFNITGILLFYPIPKIRKFPCWLSQQIGDITADYRWFAVFFLILTYVILPFFVFAISIPGPAVLFGVLIPILIIFTIIIIINIMQVKCPSKLPSFLRTWDWLPLFMHSLEPYDKLFSKMCPCKTCQKDQVQPERRHSIDAISSISMDVMDDKVNEQIDTNTANGSQITVNNGHINAAYTDEKAQV